MHPYQEIKKKVIFQVALYILQFKKLKIISTKE